MQQRTRRRGRRRGRRCRRRTQRGARRRGRRRGRRSATPEPRRIFPRRGTLVLPMRLACASLGALVFSLSATSASATGTTRAAGRSVAILPIADGDVDAATRARIEDALRKAAQTLNGVALQPKAATEASLASMTALSLACDATRRDCLVSIGG